MGTIHINDGHIKFNSYDGPCPLSGSEPLLTQTKVDALLTILNLFKNYGVTDVHIF